MNTIYEKSDCKRIKCIHLISNGKCNIKGKLPICFECRILELAEYSSDAGLKW